jgi:hypothetical protein
MLKKIFVGCALFALLANCDGPFTEENENIDEVSTLTPIQLDSLVADSAYLGKIIKERIPGWVAYQQEKNPSFNPSLFTLQDTSRYESFVTNFYPDRTFREFYGNLMVFNEDSSRIIDLYSYRYAMEKDGQGNLHIAENPDTEISLLTPGYNKKERIMFMGPVGAYDHAFWIDNRYLMVAGNADEEGLGKRNPILWLVNLKTQQIFNFTYQEELPNTARGYQIYRLKNKGMMETTPPA